MPAPRPPKPRRAAKGPFAPSPFDLAGRVALITGGSRGLGAAMAKALAEAGADVVLWARDARALDRQAKRLTGDGSRVLTQVVDVADTPRVRDAVRSAVRRFGRIDILLNNAGVWGGDDALKLTRRVWDEVLATDLTAAFFVSQAVAPIMARRRYGKIINMSSTSGVLAHLHGVAYGSAKAALIHLTRILAVEWGPYGIRVNAIAPGLFRTAMTRDVFADRRWIARRRAEIPLGRFGEPEDLGGLAVFLAAPASDHLTGQTIIIDGGASLS